MRKARLALGLLVLAILAALIWRRSSSGAIEVENRSGRPTREELSPASPSDGLQSRPRDEVREELAAQPASAPPVSAVEDEAFLRGLVVDVKSSPIADADVQVVRAEGRSFEYLGDHAFATSVAKVASIRSRSDGSFAVRLPRGRAFHLKIRADPFAVKQVYGVRAGETVVVTMRAGAVVEGIVRRSPEGTPIEGARMVFESEDGYEPMWDGKTDANGRYVAEGLDPGPASLLVIPDEERPPYVELLLKESERLTKDFDLPRGGTIEGEVRDRATGLPIAGAEVSSWSFLHKIARTDASGHYALSGFRDRPNQEIAVRADGYGQTETRIPVKDGATVRADFELPRARIVRGRVVTRAGDPIEGAYVAALAHGRDPDERIPRTDTRSSSTGGDGRFEIRNLRPDLPHALFARKDGLATTVFDLGAKEEAASVLDVGDVVLPRMATLSGRIVDAKGVGVAGAGIQVRTPRQGAIVDTEALAMVSASSDGEGRFRLVDLHAGTLRLRIYKEGFPTIEAVDVELGEGEARRGLEITLGGELSITGHVLDPDGAGVEGARVFFRAPHLSPRSFPSAVAAAEGAFVIAGLEPGEYALTAQPEPARRDLVAARAGPVRAGSTGVVLQLPRAAWITGRRASGERTWVVAFDASSARVDQTVTDEKGTFRLRAAEGSTVELGAWPAKPDLQSFWGYSGDETSAPIAMLRGIRAGATDVVIE